MKTNHKKTGSENTVYFTWTHDLSSRFALEAKLIIWSYLLSDNL